MNHRKENEFNHLQKKITCSTISACSGFAAKWTCAHHAPNVSTSKGCIQPIPSQYHNARTSYDVSFYKHATGPFKLKVNFSSFIHDFTLSALQGFMETLTFPFHLAVHTYSFIPFLSTHTHIVKWRFFLSQLQKSRTISYQSLPFHLTLWFSFHLKKKNTDLCYMPMCELEKRHSSLHISVACSYSYS